MIRLIFFTLFFLLVVANGTLTVYAQENAFREGYLDLGAHAVLSGLPDFASPSDVLQRVINFLLGLVGLLAVLALIYGGTRLVIGFGNEEQAAGAKKIILWSVTGLVVTILAWVIITTVVGFIR